MSAGVRVTCGGCGTELLTCPPGDRGAEAVVADLAACPPFCVVCAGRTVLGARPPAEIWDELDLATGIVLEQQGWQEVMT